MEHLQLQRKPWSPSYMELHMNVLELGAIRLACMALLHVLQNLVVQIFTDYMTAMHYVNKQGVPTSHPSARKTMTLGIGASGTG